MPCLIGLELDKHLWAIQTVAKAQEAVLRLSGSSRVIDQAKLQLDNQLALMACTYPRRDSYHSPIRRHMQLKLATDYRHKDYWSGENRRGTDLCLLSKPNYTCNVFTD